MSSARSSFHRTRPLRACAFPRRTADRSSRLASLLALAVLVLGPLAMDAGRAHAGEPREGGQIWAAAVAQGDLAFLHPKLDRFRTWLELQGRWRSFGESYELGMLPRVGLGYAITDRVILTAGFAVVDNDPARAKPFTELRPWQQLVWNVPVGGFAFQSRTRLEQRIHQQNVGWRLRELVRMNAPIPGTDRIYLAFYDEPFFDLDDTPWGQRRGFRQNRFFAGPGFRLDSERHFVLEAGYQNQWIDRRREDRSNHILLLTLFLNY